MGTDQPVGALFFWLGCRFVMEWCDLSRRKSSRREEDSKCVGGRGEREGVNDGKYGQREREMMGVIQIKSVGFGQSQVRAISSMPTPHPPQLFRAKPQPKSVALAHAGSHHDIQADGTCSCREHP